MRVSLRYFRGFGAAADGRLVVDGQLPGVAAQQVRPAAAGHGDLGQLCRLAVQRGGQSLLQLRPGQGGDGDLEYRLEWLPRLQDDAGLDPAAGLLAHAISMAACLTAGLLPDGQREAGRGVQEDALA